MNYPKLAIIALASSLLISASNAATTFTTGFEGGSNGLNNWPGAEAPGNAINGNASKYLNFGGENTGYIFTMSTGTAIATGINFTSANDSPERSPASYVLYGSNSASATTVAGFVYDVEADFTQISSGSLSLPVAFDTPGGNVTFSNSTAYNTFLLVFPSLVNTGATDIMQIGEAMIQTAAGNLGNAGTVGGGQLTVVVPEPSAFGLLGLALIGLVTKRRRSA